MIYKKKLHLYRLFGFSIVTFVLLYAFSCFVDDGVRHANLDGYKKVNSILVSRIDPDIISFGSSVGEKGFNSRTASAVTGRTVYNSCIDGTNFEQYRSLIEAYNSYSSKESLVLLFETYFSFVKLSAITSVERFCAHLNNKFVYQRLYNIDPSLTWKSRYIPLYKNTVVDYTYYKAAFKGWMSVFRKNNRDSLQGFVPSYSDWQPDEDAAIDTMKSFKLIIERNVIGDYIKMVNELRKNNKQVVIILPPIYERLYREKTDFGPLRQVLDSVSRITGAVFMDFSQSAISRNKGYFYNTSHLNINGSRLFTRELADSLQPYLYPAGIHLPPQ